jgi:hypothetical protein
MSGGQRKRVTFADLVTARLPATPPQIPGALPPDTDTMGGIETSQTPPEPAEGTAAYVESVHGASDSGTSIVSSASAADLHLAPAPKPAIEAPPEELIPSRPPSDSQPSSDSQPQADSLPSNVRRTFRPPGVSQTDSQASADSQPQADSLPSGDRHPLREVKGYLRLANTVVDSLLPTLDVYEQAVFIQLYRLAHGFGNYTCKVSLPALQARTGVKATSLKQAITRLQARGIVEKISAEIGFGREQGITYWVSPDGRQTYGDWQTQGGSQPRDGDNKRKEYSKETNLKGGLSPEQIKACPDCGGVGMWYPEGPGRGVARCYHPSLKAKS